MGSIFGLQNDEKSIKIAFKIMCFFRYRFLGVFFRILAILARFLDPKGSQSHIKPNTKNRRENGYLFHLQHKNSRMTPEWDPQWIQNRALVVPKSKFGDCKLMSGRRGLPNGAVGSPRAPFGNPRGTFRFRF